MKHIIFISQENDYQKNESFFQENNFIKKFNTNIYKHILENDFKNENANLIIFFGEELLKRYFNDKTFGKFFKDEESQYYYSIKNYKDFDILSKSDINREIKVFKNNINSFFRRFCITKVNNKEYYYRDINFEKIKEKNNKDADFKFITDENGDYLAYNGQKLRKIDKDVPCVNNTYDGHLSSKDLFYYENYPNIAHSKLLSYFTFDIENNMSLDSDNSPEPIISIVGYSNIYENNFVWVLKNRDEQVISKTFKNTKIFIFTDEVKMLTHFLKFLKLINIDLIGGWNTQPFDFPYLFNRCKRLNIDLEILFDGLYDKKNKAGGNEYFSDNIILWDYLKCMKWTAHDFKPISWALNNVSQLLFNESKLEHEGIAELWQNNLDKLIEYNLQDVNLTEKINIKQKLIEFPLLYQKICPQDFDNIYYNSKTIENILHQRFKQFKFPTKKKVIDTEGFEGALVTEPVPGLFRDVLALDFSSMYPSLVISFGLSPENIIDKEKSSDNDVCVDDVCISQDKPGILSELNKVFINERKRLEKKMNQYNANSNEYKIYKDMSSTMKGLSNSLYGVLGYPGFILYDKRIAKSVTYLGRELLKFTNEIAINHNYKPLFNDTDSCFVQIKANNFEDVIKKSVELKDDINNNLPIFISKFTKNQNILKNHIISIAMDKIFSKIYFSNAKKKQFGYIKYIKGKNVENEELFVKGWELKKNDTPIYWKSVYDIFYRMILDKYEDIDSFMKYIKKIKIDLYSQPIENLIIRKKMSKINYDKTIPQHIMALRNSNVAIKQGENVNMLYVKGDKEVIHYDKNINFNFEIDYDKYYERFLIDKIKLISKELHYKLFEQPNKLFDVSMMNINKMKNNKMENKSLF